MKAYCLIRPEPWYRRQAFEKGLTAVGYQVIPLVPQAQRPGDILVIWNRYYHHDLATQFEQNGGKVIVAENGYLSAGGGVPKFDVHPRGPQPGDYYALALGGHNGSGTWPDGGASRWAALGIELKPWRMHGDHILVCPSRPFGSPVMQPPRNWTADTVKALRAKTYRPIRVREHPGNDRPRRELAEDLKGAWAVVIWASSAGVHALVEGIPVICDAPRWICWGCAFWGVESFYQLPTLQERIDEFNRCRIEAMNRLAGAQWTVKEIESGEPFRRLLQ